MEGHMIVSAEDTVLELAVEALLGRWVCSRSPGDCIQLEAGPAVEEYAGPADIRHPMCVVLKADNQTVYEQEWEQSLYPWLQWLPQWVLFAKIVLWDLREDAEMWGMWGLAWNSTWSTTPARPLQR